MLNMNMADTVIINTHDQVWQASPSAGVWRKRLAREDAERGHATSVVRYDAGASFKPHNHPGGEEILVLQGTFSDETGDFGAGTYFRNPVGFLHGPFSREGCLIFVKLHQFSDGDDARLSIDTATAPWQMSDDGIESLMLHEYQAERVKLLRLPAGALLDLSAEKSVELLVVEGGLTKGSDSVGNEELLLPAGTWCRSPQGGCYQANQPTTVWLKIGHF